MFKRNFVYLSLKTISSCDLKQDTVDKYINSPDFELLLITYAVNNDVVNVGLLPPHSEGANSRKGTFNRIFHEVFGSLLFRRSTSFRERHPELISTFTTLLTDNNYIKVLRDASIELAVIKKVFGIDIKHSSFIDLSTQARSHSLPDSLSSLSALFQIEDESNRCCSQDINNFSRPGMHGDFLTLCDNEVDWLEFVEHAKNDVILLREVFKKLPIWNYPLGVELENFYVNRCLNNRGLSIDVDFVKSAVDQYEEYFKTNSRIFEESFGFRSTQNNKILEYIKSFYPDVNDVKRSTLEGLRNSKVSKLVNLKLKLCDAAPKKYKAVLRNVVGGKIRGTLTFMGASKTGRDSGKIFQPQNLKRPEIFKHVVNDDEENELIEKTITTFMSRGYEDIGYYMGELIRNVIISSPGHKLVVSDLSNIEGRTLAYLSEESFKLKNYMLQDSGRLEYDNYILAYATIMGVSPSDVTKEQRAIGKVLELSLGYGGGIKAFKSFFDSSGMSYDDLTDRVLSHVKNFNIAEKRLFDSIDEKQCGEIFDNINHLKSCMYLIHKWREKHVNIVRFWKRLEIAFSYCCRTKKDVIVNHLKISYRGDYLRIRLPSGRYLCYFRARSDMTYIAPYGSSCQRIKTHGSKLAENVSSGMARDIIYHNARKIEKAGFKLVMLVHDEVITEAREDEKYTASYLSTLLSTPVEWAINLPLMAKGFESYRYKGK